jgi:hypothetical protein
MAAVLRDLGDHAFEEFGNELRRRGAMRGEMKVVYEEIRTTTTRVVTGGELQAVTAMLGSLSLGGGGGGGGGVKALPPPPFASGGSYAPASARSKFKTEICRDWAKGGCPRGWDCSFAHGATEINQSRVNPTNRFELLNY